MRTATFLAGLFLTVSAATAQPATPETPLPSRFEYQMEKFRGKLPYLEQLLAEDRPDQARGELEDLLADIDTRVGWTNGAVHPENPAVLELKAAVRGLLDRAVGGAATPAATPPATSESPKAAPATAEPPRAAVTASTVPAPPEPAAAGPLPSSFRYHFDKLPAKLELAEGERKRGRYPQALELANSVLDDLAKRVEWSSGKVSPDHPEVVAFRTKVEALKASLAAQAAAAGDAAASLGPVVKAIQELVPRVAQAVSDGRFALSSLTGLEDAYSTHQDVTRVDATRDEALPRVTRAAEQAALARETAASFRAQFPDPSGLRRLLPDQAEEAFGALGTLERQATTWGEVCLQATRTLVEAAEQATTEAEQRVAAVDPGKPAEVSYADSSARMYAVNLYGRLLGVPASIFPAATGDAKTLVERAHVLEGRVLALEDRLSTLKGQAADAAARRVREARFPTRGITDVGADRDAVLAALQEEFRDGAILRLGVTAPWEIRTEARWVRDHWDVGTFHYLGVVLATSTPSGKYRVYRVTLRQRRQPDGSWSPVRHFSVGDSFEILKENIAG